MPSSDCTPQIVGLMSLVVGSIGVGIGIASLIINLKNSILRKPKFTYPKHKSYVRHKFECGGTCSRWSSQTIWIFVCPVDVETTTYYPQRAPAIRDPRGNWIATAYVGASPGSDPDKEFVIYTVTANKVGTIAIYEYISRCLPGNIWPGLPQLPKGCKWTDSISVIHREN